MSFYVNPRTETKESFLRRVSAPKRLPVAWDETPADHLPVVWVHNGPFTAAAICHSKEDYERFVNDLEDTRPKIVFHVKIADLVAVAPDFASYMERQTA